VQPINNYGMKIAITGHTKGIGRQLTSTLIENGHEVLGFSRSNDYDIGDQTARDRIFSTLNDIDVFVNNAYDPVGQYQLLVGAVNMWEGTNKLIINVNSKSIYADVVLPEMKEYVDSKKKQLDFILQRRLTASPQILNITLGLVDTEMAEIFDAKKISPTDLAKLLTHLIELKDKIYVQDMMIDVPNQSWNNIKLK
jgi:short-subunit dehydrogenase